MWMGTWMRMYMGGCGEGVELGESCIGASLELDFVSSIRDNSR